MSIRQPDSKGAYATTCVHTRRRLLHCVKLNHFGGVGAQFAEFLPIAQQRYGWDAEIIACGRHSIHSLISDHLPNTTPPHYEKYAGCLKLPGWPGFVRQTWQRHLFKRSGADAALLWNELGRSGLNVLKAVRPENCVYWERGTAWVPGVTAHKKRFVQNLTACLANSYASKRMLELRWNYEGQIQVVHNALRPSLLPSVSRARSAPANSYRLGMVGRLIPLKGVPIALHAIANILSRGYQVTLDIAGDGPELANLIQLAEHLGIAESVRFHGLVQNMVQFYENMDLLIHPTLQESFGLIANEAHAYGIPTIVTAVDGLVEAVDDNNSGICIPPSEPLSVYAELGGGDGGIPPYVYNPAEDTIDTPKVMAPDMLADTVISLMGDPSRYERMSQHALDRVQTEFNFNHHVRRALNAIDNYLISGKLELSDNILATSDLHH